MIIYAIIDKDTNKVVLACKDLPYDPADSVAREAHHPAIKYEILTVEAEENKSLLEFLFYTVQLSDGVYSIIAASDVHNFYLAKIRTQRNISLDKLDYTQLAHRIGTKDHTGVTLTTERAALWAAHMEELRDLPSTITDAKTWFASPQWPEEP